MSDREVVNISGSLYLNHDSIKSIVPNIKSIVNEDFTESENRLNGSEKVESDSNKKEGIIYDNSSFNYVAATLPFILNSGSYKLFSLLKEGKTDFKKRKLIDRQSKNKLETDYNEFDVDSSESEEVNRSYKKAKKLLFVEIDSFLKSIDNNLDKQILSFSISNFPNYSNEIIGNLLSMLIEDIFSSDKFQMDAFSWTSTTHGILEFKTVYITLSIRENTDFTNFNKNLPLKIDFVQKNLLKFIKVADSIKLANTILKVNYSENTKKLIEIFTGRLKIENLHVETILDGNEDSDSKLQDYIESKQKEISEYLKKVDDSNNYKPVVISNIDDYKINYKELVDLPKKLLPEIIEGIKEFRLNMVNLENQKNMKRSLEEKKKLKMKFKKLSSSINKAQVIKTNNMDLDQDSGDSSDDDEDQDSMMSDLEFERLQQENMKQKENQKYEAELKLIEINELSEKKVLIDKLHDLQDYEQKRLIKQDELIGTYDKVFINSDSNNEVGELIKYYKTNFDKYIKERKYYRDLETKKDDHNREVNRESDILLNDLLGNENSTNNNGNKGSEKFKIGLKKTPELFNLSKEKLAEVVDSTIPAMRKSVEEYLGEVEEDLVQYLCSSIKNNVDRSSIFEEVSNFMDDDTKAFLDSIFKSLKQNI